MICRGTLVVVFIVALLQTGLAQEAGPSVDWQMVASIREEGFERSQLADTLSYMTDVLGARYTLSQDMTRAQAWAIAEMERIGLVNTVIEPFMDYGVSWDNEYFSLHLLEPDYQPMVGYPLANTPGTAGKQQLQVVIADVRTQHDFERYRGRLHGVAVLSTPSLARSSICLRSSSVTRTSGAALVRASNE